MSFMSFETSAIEIILSGVNTTVTTIVWIHIIVKSLKTLLLDRRVNIEVEEEIPDE